METLIHTLNRLSDDELLARLKAMARRERDAAARVVAHLAIVDARRLYLPEGCSSMFTYCTEVLHFSERAAYGRIVVARAVRRYPPILERLAEGSLNLTTVRLLSPHLTADNHRGMLDEAANQSRRQLEELVARLRQAQELMRHQLPNGDPAEILDRALRDLVEKLSRRKFAALTRSRAGGR